MNESNISPEIKVYGDAIAEGIEAGWNAASRGELANESEVRAHMQQRKRIWLERPRSA